MLGVHPSRWFVEFRCELGLRLRFLSPHGLSYAGLGDQREGRLNVSLAVLPRLVCVWALPPHLQGLQFLPWSSALRFRTFAGHLLLVKPFEGTNEASTALSDRSNPRGHTIISFVHERQSRLFARWFSAGWSLPAARFPRVCSQEQFRLAQSCLGVLSVRLCILSPPNRFCFICALLFDRSCALLPLEQSSVLVLFWVLRVNLLVFIGILWALFGTAARLDWGEVVDCVLLEIWALGPHLWVPKEDAAAEVLVGIVGVLLLEVQQLGFVYVLELYLSKFDID